MSMMIALLLNHQKINQSFSFAHTLLYLCRDYFNTPWPSASAGLLGQQGLQVPMRQPQDIHSLAYLLQHQHQQPLFNSSSHVAHCLLSWQDKDYPTERMVQRVQQLLVDLNRHCSQALWFIHRQQSHPHVHLLLCSSGHETLTKPLLQKHLKKLNSPLTRSSDVRGEPLDDLPVHQLRTQPMSFYQWFQHSLREDLLEALHDPIHSWQTMQNWLEQHGIQLVARHQSYVFKTTAMGRDIYLKPSRVDGHLSGRLLSLNWGPFTPLKTHSHQSFPSYQHHVELFDPHSPTFLSLIQTHGVNRDHLAQLTLQYHQQNRHAIALHRLPIDNQKLIDQQKKLVVELEAERIIGIRMKKRWLRCLSEEYPSLETSRHWHKKTSWIGFLIHQCYQGNRTALRVLNSIWQAQRQANLPFFNQSPPNTLSLNQELPWKKSGIRPNQPQHPIQHHHQEMTTHLNFDQTESWP